MPASDIPGEIAAATQPFTALTPPLSPHSLDTSQAWGLTETDRQACSETLAGLRNEGIFTPPSLQGTLVYPSNIGGAHWGGVAVDPERQIAVVPVNRTAWMVQLFPREEFNRADMRAQDARLQLVGSRRLPGGFSVAVGNARLEMDQASSEAHNQYLQNVCCLFTRCPLNYLEPGKCGPLSITN